MSSGAAIDLPSLHRGAARSIVRVEARDSYAPESPDFLAWQRGEARAERSVRTNDYLARVAAATLAGIAWERLRVITTPPSAYELFELEAYRESQAAGEIVTLAPRELLPADPIDVWLIDGVAIVQDYDEHDAFLARRYATDAEAGHALHLAGRIRELGTPLNRYLAAAAIPAARRAS